MLRRLLSGCALALCAAVVLVMGGGSELEHVALLGAALGAVIGLVPDGPPLGRLGGFALGLAAAWIAFGIRALLLPDSTSGRAVAAFLVILVCSAVTAVSAGKAPLWSTLVGAAAMVGAYETSYTGSPSQLLTASPQAATTVLLAAGFGFIGATLITTFLQAPAAASTPDPRRVPVAVAVNSTSTPGPRRAPAVPDATPTYTSHPRAPLGVTQDTVARVTTGESK